MDLTELGKNSIAIPTISDCETDKLRKMLEIAFADTDINVLLYVRPGELSREDPTIGKVKRKQGETETIVVKGQGKTYTDLLRKMKTVVKDGETTGITKLRSTKEGDLLLKIKGNSQKAGNLKKYLRGDERSCSKTPKL